MAGTYERQVWFGPPSAPLFGWLTLPSDGCMRGGVVVCPPIGREIFSTHRTIRRLTTQLAEAGYAALRFDYEGTGDSCGGPDDAGQVGAWLGSIATARAYLTGLGALRITTIGLRLGATLAAFDAATHSGEAGSADSLILWDPCVSGRAFLREGEALLATSEAGHLPKEPSYRHTPGFQFSLETAQDLRGLDFAKLPTTHELARRILVLQRDDRPRPSALADRLAVEGDRVSYETAWGQAELMDVDVTKMTVPQPVLDRIVSWVDADADRWPMADLQVPPDAAEAHTAVIPAPGRAAVEERATAVGHRGINAIVSEQVGSANSRGWVVLMNIGTEHHIGPGRLWVDLARDWAAKGYRVLRLDQTGSGDSSTHPDQREAVPYPPHWIDDMRDLITTLRADGSSVVMIGLCAGAYSSMEAAMWEKVDGIFGISPILTLYTVASKGMVHWTSRRRAAIVPGYVMSWVPEHKLPTANRLWWLWTQFAFWNAPFRVLRRVVNRGTRLTVLVNEADARALKGYAFWHYAFKRLLRRPSFRFIEKHDFDHSMLDRGSQRYMAAEATAFLESFPELKSGDDQ